jgi:uncharacterized Zn finger protein
MAAKKITAAAADSDRTRTFPPFPPTVGSRAAFAESWWGRAWIDALENTSLDAARLTRGRTYARRGAVEQITVTPSIAKAKVRGSRPRPYSSSVGVKQLSDRDWERFLDAIAGRAVHIAALLDRDMPPGLIDARAAGVRLLPGVGDLDPDCSCPDWGWPCKHASALCYQIARLLDTDPFVLFLLRGRGEQEVMEELRARNARAAAAAAAASKTAADTASDPMSDSAALAAPAATSGAPFVERPAGVSATTVFGSEPDRVSQLATILGFEVGALPDRPEPPPVLASTAKNKAIDDLGLEMVAADTAHRAHALMAEYTASTEPARIPLLPRQSTWQDAVRAVATRPGDTVLASRIADRYDLQEDQLAVAVRAWHQGGAAGLEALEHTWSPTTADKARTRTALEEYADDFEPPLLRLWRNRWTAEAEGVQIRLGTDNRWYPYRRHDDGSWWPDGPAERDPGAALAGLLEDARGG